VRALWILVLCALVYSSAQAQNRTNKSHKTNTSKKKPELNVQLGTGATFVPTCNLDSNSVGFYFFPANLGAKWSMRTISQVFDARSKLLKSDTTYSYEHVISDSERSLQGLPLLTCESSFPYRAGFEDSVKKKVVQYYLDDSVIIAVVNHSVNAGLSHILLVNPLNLGAQWRDDLEDTIHSRIIAIEEPITTVLGTFPHALVVQSRLGFGELSKYFVKGMGMVKSVYRGISPKENGAFVVTSELIKLETGDPKRSVKYRFPKPIDERYRPRLIDNKSLNKQKSTKTK
jgi:hypothetical protein